MKNKFNIRGNGIPVDFREKILFLSKNFQAATNFFTSRL